LMVLCWFALMVVGAAAAGLYELEGKIVVKDDRPIIILHGNGGQLFTYTRSDGSFKFQDIPAGVFIIEVASNNYAYPNIRLDISARLSGKVRARYADDSTKAVKYPLRLQPLEPIQYFEERQGFNLASLYKNQMVIMIGLLLLTMFIPNRSIW